MARLEIEGLSKHFGSTVAVHEVSLDVRDGEFVMLLGPSGCGKTTTLRMIAGFIAPTAGRVRLGGKDITMLPPWKRNTGMVFQSYALFPHLTVAENVAFGLEMRKVPKSDIPARVTEALRLVRLGGLAERLPRQLSGGQQQRVALARALVIRPDVLLLDEPLSNLDAKLRETVRVEIRELQHKLGITTVMVTHDQEEALIMADRLVVMSEGAVRQVGSQRDLYERPADRFVAGFVGRSNLLSGRVIGPGRFETEAGVAIACLDGALGPGVIALRPERLALGAAAAGLDNRLQRHGRAGFLSRRRRSTCTCACRARTAWWSTCPTVRTAPCRRKATGSTWAGPPPPRSCWPKKAAQPAVERATSTEAEQGGAMSNKTMQSHVSRRGVLKGAAAARGLERAGRIPGVRPDGQEDRAVHLGRRLRQSADQARLEAGAGAAGLDRGERRSPGRAAQGQDGRREALAQGHVRRAGADRDRYRRIDRDRTCWSRSICPGSRMRRTS